MSRAVRLRTAWDAWPTCMRRSAVFSRTLVCSLRFWNAKTYIGTHTQLHSYKGLKTYIGTHTHTTTLIQGFEDIHWHTHNYTHTWFFSALLIHMRWISVEYVCLRSKHWNSCQCNGSQRVWSCAVSKHHSPQQMLAVMGFGLITNMPPPLSEVASLNPLWDCALTQRRLQWCCRPGRGVNLREGDCALTQRRLHRCCQLKSVGNLLIIIYVSFYIFF